MAQKGASLQSTNTDLIKHIESLRLSKNHLDRSIRHQEEEKEKLVHSIRILEDKMGRLDDALKKKNERKQELDRMLRETEQAYSKILESSQTLLHVLRRESQVLGDE
mmetsp:Transcript_2723/g.10455  ORF Transcript_2723/g.10455 Transcript_2723/m.10455 type:complete len:107 (-) Transcript_2723:417-737(-)